MTLPDFSSIRLLIVGDVMLDRYWFGDASRVSPEAPVPVVKIGHCEERPGGAANVARNAAALGANVTLLSLIGRDEAGKNLDRLLCEGGIDTSLHVDDTLSTTIKLRVLARGQQLLRIDFETPPSSETLRAKLDDFSRRLPDCDAVVFSDYGKGGLAHIQKMIQLARTAGKAVLVDPKGDDYSAYAGATIITPNRSEMREVVGRWQDDADLERRAAELRTLLGLKALLITRSEEGMSLFLPDRVIHAKAVALEVFDVSGAGDTVIATLAVMLACGSAWAEAIHAANIAAGIVVGKLGTAVVTRDELEQLI